MDLAENPEIGRCWDMNPKTWILQRTLRYIDAETWIGDMVLAEDPEIHMDADIRIRTHGSSRGSWDTCGCWDMNPDVWISQRILRYIWMLRYGSGDMDLAEELEIHMNTYIRIRRHGSCRGSWDTYRCWDLDPETWILQRTLRYKDAETWMLRHESDTWILQRILRFEDAETWIRRHGLIYGSGDMVLAEDPEIHMDAEIRIRRHGSCRGAWDTYECLYTDPETWILQRFLRYMWMLRHESEDMDLAEDSEV